MSLLAILRCMSVTARFLTVTSLGLSSLLAGCSSSPSGVEVADRNKASQGQVTTGNYTVRPGDTLWSIAFRFGWDWRDLAQRNGIASPYMIYPGQKVYFDRRVSQKVTAPAAVSPKNVSQTKATSSLTVVPITSSSTVVKASESQKAASVAATTPVTPVARSVSGWAWPANGAVISTFSSSDSLNKGIDIAGQLGEPVLAASAGSVVYAGSGLRGYGELVIIKHNDTFVSAYGHNQKLLVREGQQVKTGQKIAEMGSTGTDRVKLHFEIRRQGKPIDPMQYLPSR